MTDISPAAATARETARHPSGQFGEQEHTAPEASLNFRAELDTVNTLYQGNTERIQEEVALYLQYGMPEGAHTVELEHSDQGNYLTISRAFDKDGVEIETEEEYDRWADADSVISHLGHPDDNRDIHQLLPMNGNGVHVWTRSGETNDADEQTIRERIDKLFEVREELGAGSQAAAITAVRRLMPEGSTLHLTWGDQGGPDYLTVESITLADGTEHDMFSALDEGIDWDDIDQAASDIRDSSDANLTAADEHGNYFTLRQNPHAGSTRIDSTTLATELRKQAKAAIATEGL